MRSIQGAARWPRRLFAVAALLAAFSVQAASTGSTSLLRITGAQGGSGFGDYVSDAGALNRDYVFYVEVPPGTPSLQIDIFDADVGAAGNADDTGNRDRLRSAFNTRTEYRLFNPANAPVMTNFTQGTNTQPPGADNAWLNFYTTSNPTPGHWRIEIDSSSGETTGDDVNAFGLRAHDGNAGSGGVELNIYANNMFQIGINPDPNGSRTSLFTYYPYVTHGCNVEASDFDFDRAGALTAGAAQNISFRNRSGSFTQTFANGTLSDNDAWNTENMADPTTFPGGGPSGNQTSRNGYGLWPSSWRINEVDAENANFATLLVGPETTDAMPPADNPEAFAFRVYFPTDAGTPPQKPYMVQYYQHVTGPNPPSQNQNTTLQVNVVFVNPTPYPVTFSSTNTITTRVGGPTTSNNTNAGTSYVGNSATVDQGTVTGQPANNGTGLITWNPGTVAGGTNAILSYRVVVRPPNNNSGSNRRFTGQGNSTTNNEQHGTRARFVDETGVSQAQATYTIDGLCGLSYRVGTSAPVPVTLSSVAAARQGGGVRVEWTTATETGNGGFDVFGRRADGSWIRLTDAPVMSRAADGVEEQAYAITVSAPADVAAIAIEDIALDGQRKRHEPIAIGTTSGARAGARIDWSGVDRSAAQGSDRNGPIFLEVVERGIHRASVAQLAAAGQDIAGFPTASLALRDASGPVPVRIIGASGATLGPNAVIEFLGEPRDSLYGTANRYSVAIDREAARRPAVSALDAAEARTERDRWRGETARANDAAYSVGALGDDPWYDTLLTASAGAPVSFDFTLDVAGAATLDDATVAVAIEGETEWPQDRDHRFDLLVNGTMIARHEFDGRTIEAARFPIPAGVLRAGSNTVTIALPADQGVPFDRMRLESVSIGYDRTLQAENGRIFADLGETGDTIEPAASGLMRDGFDEVAGGCADSGCTLLRIGDIAGEATAWLRAGTTSTLLLGVPGNDGLELVTPRSHGELFVAQEDRVLTPALVRGSAPAADVPAGTDLVVIAHPAFADGLGSFVTARQAEGLDVVVAATDAIYARYSAGLPEPAAVRAYIAAAHARGARYALLVGGDTYDYADRLGTGATSFVPTMYTWTDDDVRFAPSDALLGDVDDDGLPEVAVGRWPVRTTAELDAIVAKTLAYASAPHGGKAVFAADDPEEVHFGELSGYVADALSTAGWSVDRIEVATGDASAARSALVAAINQGRALTHFVGHAGVDRWTFEPLLLADQVGPLLSNTDAPTIVAQWGCWSSYFVSPFANSVAHQFLFDPDGGAAAVIGGATRVRQGETDEALRAFASGIGTGEQRLGDAIDAMRRATAAADVGRRDLVHGVVLLGDPTLKLRR